MSYAYAGSYQLLLLTHNFHVSKTLKRATLPELLQVGGTAKTEAVICSKTTRVCHCIQPYLSERNYPLNSLEVRTLCNMLLLRWSPHSQGLQYDKNSEMSNFVRNDVIEGNCCHRRSKLLKNKHNQVLNLAWSWAGENHSVNRLEIDTAYNMLSLWWTATSKELWGITNSETRNFVWHEASGTNCWHRCSDSLKNDECQPMHPASALER